MKEKKFIKLTPFKMQVLQSFPFIDADFDALTNYELLCKVVEYLNITVDNVNYLDDEVNNYIIKFNELKSYVDNYFDNLDVQEEINNKLDEMAESGQLTDIIAQYLGLAGMITFDTVADMKLAENLVNGSKCQTLGYYNISDGGNALYKIRTKTISDTPDDAFIIELNDNTLVAELVYFDTVNVRTIGVKGDGETDETLLIQKAFDSVATTIYFPEGIYLIKVDRVTCTLTDTTDNSKCAILINNNKKIIKGNNAILKSIHTTESSGYDLYAISSNYPLEVYNITFNGQYNDLSYTYGLQLNTSYNKVNNCKFTNLGGSGIVLNGTSVNNINNNMISECEFNNCGNSIFCAWVNKSSFTNLKFYNVSEGIDFDKKSSNIVISDLVANEYRGDGADSLIEINGCSDFAISNISCKNFIDGIIINGKIITTENLELTTISENITIDNCIFDTINGYGIVFGNVLADIQECVNINMNNIQVIKATISAFHLRGDNIKLTNSTAELCNHYGILLDSKANSIYIDNFTNKKCKKGFIQASVGSLLSLTNIYDDEDGNNDVMNSINGVTELLIDNMRVVNTSNFSTTNNRLYYIKTSKANLNNITMPILSTAIMYVTADTLYKVNNCNMKLNVVEVGSVTIIKSNLTPSEIGSGMQIQTGTILIYEGGLNNANIYICTSGNYGGGVLHWQSITGTPL